MTCLRCGDFFDAGPIDGLALCARCLEERDPPESAQVILPPREVASGLVVRVLGIVACVGAGLAVLEVSDNVAFAIVAAIVAGLFLVAVENARCAERRREWILEKHGLLALPRSEMVLAQHESDVPGQLDVGPLVIAEGGLVFFGQRGTRATMPRSAVKSATPERFGQLLLELAGRRRRFILTTGKDGLSATKLAARLAERLSPAAGSSRSSGSS